MTVADLFVQALEHVVGQIIPGDSLLKQAFANRIIEDTNRMILRREGRAIEASMRRCKCTNVLAVLLVIQVGAVTTIVLSTGFVFVEGGKSFLLTIFIHPSQELEQNVSLETRFQCTANTSRLCSCHDWMGN